MREDAGLRISLTFCRVFLLAALLAALPAPATAATEAAGPKSILYLYSYGHGSKGVSIFDDGMLDTLFANGVNLNNLYFEYLDLERNRGDARYLDELTAELERKYPKGKINLIMTGQQPALRFLLDRGKAVASGATVITFQAPPPTPAEAEGRHFFSILARFDVEGTVRHALDVFPGTRKVLVVAGDSDADRATAKLVQKTVESFADRVAFEYTTGMALDEVLKRVSSTEPRTLILFTQFNKDSTGKVTVAYEVEGAVVKKANAPVFGLYDFNLRNGGVGGSVVSVHGLGVQMANLMLDILAGRIAPAAQVTPVQSTVVPLFDWDQLKQLGGKPERLPEGTVFVNRTPSIWESYRWFILGAGALVTLETALIAMLLTMRRRQLAAERLLKQSEEKFSKSFQHAPLLMSINDVASGLFLEVNERFCEVSGFSREEVLGRTSVELGMISRETRDRLLSEFEEKGAVEELALPMRAKDGSTIHCLYSAEIVTVDGQPRLVSISQDVTARKRAETEARELSLRLAQAQKMEAIGTLAGGIAHDFNNILGAVLGYTELTLATLPPGSEARENLQEVLIAGQRARDLVHQILAFSRKADKRKLPVETSRIVGEALKLLVSVIPKTIRIDRTIDANAGQVLADPTEIHQVVMNLCTNAYQAMSCQESGVLSLRLSGVILGALEAAAIPGLKPGAYVRLDVEDTGPGIKEELRERIFEPYFTTKEVGGGTGLGLATVHGIVVGLGGVITVHSSPGVGSVFTVYLPIHLSEVAGLTSPRPPAAAPGKGNVLFVDDEQGLARLGRKLLESLGYRVRETTDPREALTLFENDPYAFDVIVTDMTMPGLTGAELVRRARAVRPDIPAVVCTGYSDLLNEESARKQGIAAFVNKPFDRDALGGAVATALGLKPWEVVPRGGGRTPQ